MDRRRLCERKARSESAMFIRYGCELSILVERPTPAFCLVDVHPDRRRDIVREKPLRASPGVTFAAVSDAFGNILQRCVLPPGETSLILDGVIEDAGLADVRDAEARTVPVNALPGDIATYLNGSRYCETDKLGSLAWATFGHLVPGTEMVQVICDFTHERWHSTTSEHGLRAQPPRPTRRRSACAGTSRT
jgi:hypothetical protein